MFSEPNVKTFHDDRESTAANLKQHLTSNTWATSSAAYNTTQNSISYDPLEENTLQHTNKGMETTPELTDIGVQTFEQPKITIQEIIPEVKEIPMTEPSKVIPVAENIEKSDTEDLEATQTATEIEKEDDAVTFDVDSDSSEISEVYQHPSPVLRIGDKLLFLKKGELVSEKDTSTPASVITIIGAEGLQRGFEDSGEMHEALVKNGTTNTKEAAETSDAALENSTQHIPSVVNQNNNYSDSTAEIIKVVPLEEATTENTVENTDVNSVPQTTETLIQESSTTEESITTTSELEIDEEISSSDISTTPLEELATSDLQPTTEEVEIHTQSLENDTLVNSDENLTTETNILEVTSTTVKQKNEESKDDVAQEENPAYPPIPDIMMPIHVYDVQEQVDHETLLSGDVSATVVSTTETVVVNSASNTEKDSKILPDVLEIRNNHSIPANATHPDWLKNDSFVETGSLINSRAALPEHLLSQTVGSDFQKDINTHNSITEEITTEIVTDEVKSTAETIDSTPSTTETQKGRIPVDDTKHKVILLADEPTLNDDTTAEDDNIKETVENISEEGGEATTRKNSHASLMSNENASIDVVENNSPEITSTGEQVEILPTLRESAEETENKSVELKDSPKIIETSTNKLSPDVEMFNPETLTKSSETRTSGPEKIVEKRENSMDDQVFEQLNKELEAESTQRMQTKEAESKEAEEIFKELLKETDATEKPKQPENVQLESRNKETEVLQRVSDAIAKFQLRDSQQSLDTSILGILRDFFTSQYRS